MRVNHRHIYRVSRSFGNHLAPNIGIVTASEEQSKVSSSRVPVFELGGTRFQDLRSCEVREDYETPGMKSM